MRFIVVGIIILLLAIAWWPDPPVNTVEDTFIAPQLVPLGLVGLDHEGEAREVSGQAHPATHYHVGVGAVLGEPWAVRREFHGAVTWCRRTCPYAS